MTKFNTRWMLLNALTALILFGYSQSPTFSKTPHSVTLSVGEQPVDYSRFVINASQLRKVGG